VGRILYKLNLTFVSLLFLVSCNMSRNQIYVNFQDSLEIQTSKPIPDPCLAMFYFEAGASKFLFADDRENQEIRVFNLNSNREVESIHLSDTGVNSIPFHFGFIIKNLDSIYLPGSDHKLYCINRNGDIIKKIDFSSIVMKYPQFTTPLSLSRFTKGAIIINNEIYFLQHDSRKNYFYHKPSDYHFLLKYDIKNDSFGISPISLPDNFWKDGKREMSILLTYNNLQKVLVFGTQYSDKIFISNDGTTITKTYRSKSKSIWQYFPYSPPDNLSGQEYIYSLCKYSYNVGIIWNPYKRIYYRFVWPGMQSLKINQRSLIDEIFENFPTFTIDILDNEFNILGSYSLPNKKYNWNYYFITKDGLYLGENKSSKDKIGHNWVFHLLKVQIPQ
jgi:hypothetical protein